MTPFDWNIALAPAVSWPKIKVTVEREARVILSKLLDDETINTAQLIEALYPAVTARGPEIDCRQRMIRVLLARKADGAPSVLADCRERAKLANLRRYYGREVHPWLWHKPTPKLCPHCGGVL
jgi:hypothetical protein